MFRKSLHLFLAIALVLTMLPLYPSSSQAAAGDGFIFENVPSAVNAERITLSGTLLSIAPTGISYMVERVSSRAPNATVLEKRDKSTYGINVSTDGTKITVYNLQLFPGFNRITFFGQRGGSTIPQVVDPIIEYVDAPALFDLAFAGSGKSLPINDFGTNVVTNAYASNSNQGLFTIQGKAPNAREVLVFFGDNDSRNAPVREDGTFGFTLAQVKLKKGKNTLKFQVKNAAQVIEVVREVVYYDDTVTFYDVKLQENSDTEGHDLSQRSAYFVPGTTDKTTVKLTGKVIVPNDSQPNRSEKMRIEAAYRLAGKSGAATNPLSSDPNIPDGNDKIVIRFSAAVDRATNMIGEDIRNLIKFKNAANAELPVAPATLSNDTRAEWGSSMVNGVNVSNSQLTISIAQADAPLLANVAYIELNDDVAAAVDTTNRIQVSDPSYKRQAILAGSFDHTRPYVTNAYVKGNTLAGSQRGIDPEEKIIIQLEDSAAGSLSRTNASNYLMTKIDAMIDLGKQTTTPTVTAAGELGTGSGSPKYTMIYNGSAQQIEIIFEKNVDLSSLLGLRSDEGVGVPNTDLTPGNDNGAAAYINLNALVRPDNTPISKPAPEDYQSGATYVRIGGSFDADGVSANPDPENIDLQFANATYYDEKGNKIDSHDFQLVKDPQATYSDTDAYFVFDYEIYHTTKTPAPTIPGLPGAFPDGSLDFDKYRFIELKAIDKKKSRQSGREIYDGTGSSELGYILRNETTPYIQSMDVNLREAVPSTPPATTTDELAAMRKWDRTSASLTNGTAITNVPFAVKLTIPNGTGIANDIVPTVKSKKDPNDIGKAASILSTPATFIYDNNIGTTTREVWFWVTKLPYDGTQTLDIDFNGLKESVTINMITSAFVKFDKVTENMIIQYDPTETLANVSSDIITTKLGNFAGEFTNIPKEDIYYNDATVGKKQSVFFTINNNPVQLKGQAGSYANETKFQLDPALDVKDIRAHFNDGANTLKMVYIGYDDKGKEVFRYEKVMTVNLFSKNYPVIPFEGEEIFPYGTDFDKPKKDKRFTGGNGIYTTQEAYMNIAGSFDFINLGKTTTDITNNRQRVATGQYVLVIEGPGGPWEWDLAANRFTTEKGGRTIPGSAPTTGLSVIYQDNDDEAKQYFKFILANQKVPASGESVVYTFKVYNNGKDGSSVATNRLEIKASGIPYKLLRPLPQQTTINQNYVEVILYAENADKVMVNKTEAEKYDFDGNYDGDMNDVEDGLDYHAFRAIVKDLKPNKLNKVTYTITQGSDTITGSFEVFYALANMPGAQYLETMKASHKLFEGKLNLTFPKDTYLRRVDYNVPENLRTQVFKGHDLLFAIANSKDGVVDRFDYIDPQPRNFKTLVEDLGARFYSSFDRHFVKASEVYWIDGGLADDPDTNAYDPHATGLLPHQLGDLPSYDRVPTNRMLVPNKRGTLELSYDSNIVSGAGNNITVMRFDPEYQYWENLGGQINAGKRTIKIPFDKFGYYVVTKFNDSFPDVNSHPYARNHVEAMFSKGIIKPKRAGEFGVDDNTTRAEFTAMVVRALQLPLVEKPSEYTFADVPTVIDQTSLWDYRYIETASRLGLVRGTNPGIFEPNGRITREEAAVILARALQLKLDTVPAKIDKDLQKLFKDYNLIQLYSRASVLAIAKKKFIMGSPVDPNDLKKGYVFEPNANMLRGDAAILIARVMADLKKIPPVGEVK
ncbi:MAG: S-layer homology domain-containing protein [Clostridia bacterium]